MNIALILAAGVGQRMRNAGLPKQFLKIMGKPIIIYTLEKFDTCEEIDSIIVACHGGYVDYLKELLITYNLKKVKKVFVGGNERQASITKGIEELSLLQKEEGFDQENTILIIHDGVRPLINETIIRENINSAQKYGCALTVHPVKESVVITDKDDVSIDDFKERAKTFSLTSPQSFKFEYIKKAFEDLKTDNYNGMPLLDAAMVYAKAKGSVHMVKEQGSNIKITTPEDFYYLKAIIELEEQKYIFGL